MGMRISAWNLALISLALVSPVLMRKSWRSKVVGEMIYKTG